PRGAISDASSPPTAAAASRALLVPHRKPGAPHCLELGLIWTMVASSLASSCRRACTCPTRREHITSAINGHCLVNSPEPRTPAGRRQTAATGASETRHPRDKDRTPGGRRDARLPRTTFEQEVCDPAQPFALGVGEGAPRECMRHPSAWCEVPSPRVD